MSKDEIKKETSKKAKKEIWALRISILSIIVTSIFSGRQCELQNEVSQKEFNIGKAQIISLVSRYAVVTFNQFSLINTQDGRLSGTLKKDSISIKQYLTDCEYILDGLRRMESNPFYVKLLTAYPQINLLIIQLQRDIIEQKMKTFTLNENTFLKFHDLFFFLKENYKDEVFDTDYFKIADTSFTQIKKQWPK
jgi:hypothetical protein